MKVRTVALSAASLLVMTAIAGCSAPSPTAGPADGDIRIVASTNVWGGIAASIAGDRATVTSFIASATQDPHSYEASARDQLAISRAGLIIENGGGYDPFMDVLLDGAGNTEAVVINASEESTLLPEDDHAADDQPADDHAADDHAVGEHDHVEGFNEHVWYSFEAVRSVAGAIASELSALDSAHAAEYSANLATFSTEIDALIVRSDELKAEFAGEGAAITEPVPLYLLEAAGLVNLTPEAFSSAFEEGSDVSPLAMRDLTALLEEGTVAVFAYNDQTTSAQGEQILTVANRAGVPTVAFTETLPEGRDYESWMTANLDALSTALHS
jgi:zinc/manganese transport system substrate-binding protein